MFIGHSSCPLEETERRRTKDEGRKKQDIRTNKSQPIAIGSHPSTQTSMDTVFGVTYDGGGALIFVCPVATFCVGEMVCIKVSMVVVGMPTPPLPLNLNLCCVISNSLI